MLILFLFFFFFFNRKPKLFTNLTGVLFFFLKISDSETPLSAAFVFPIVPEAELLQSRLKAGRTAEN